MTHLNRMRIYLLLALVILAAIGCQPTQIDPRGYELLFCANQAVYEVTIDSRDISAANKVLDLPRDATCPVWSPDGKQALLYSFKQTGLTIDDSLSLIERQSSAIHEIYHFGPRDTEWAMRWLSNGISLLLLSARNYKGSERCSELFQTRSINGTDCWTAYTDIYKADVYAKDSIAEFAALTTAPEARCDIAESPTGKLIAYTHGSGCTAATEVSNVEIFDSETGEVTLLVNRQVEDSAQSNSFPQWSSSGDRVLFSSVRLSDHSRQQLEANTDDWKVHAVVVTNTQQGYLSPDGKKVLWWADNWNSLGITNVEGGQSLQWQLPAEYDRYRVNPYGWSPDSRHFAGIELNGRTGEGAIRIIDLVSTQIITLSVPLPHGIAWSPDNQWLAFSVWRPVEPNKCQYQIDIYAVRPNGTDLRKITQGQQFSALQCPPQGWRGYRLNDSDLQWTPRIQ